MYILAVNVLKMKRQTLTFINSTAHVQWAAMQAAVDLLKMMCLNPEARLCGACWLLSNTLQATLTNTAKLH